MIDLRKIRVDFKALFHQVVDKNILLWNHTISSYKCNTQLHHKFTSSNCNCRQGQPPLSGEWLKLKTSACGLQQSCNKDSTIFLGWLGKDSIIICIGSTINLAHFLLFRPKFGLKHLVACYWNPWFCSYSCGKQQPNLHGIVQLLRLGWASLDLIHV